MKCWIVRQLEVDFSFRNCSSKPFSEWLMWRCCLLPAVEFFDVFVNEFVNVKVVHKCVFLSFGLRRWWFEWMLFTFGYFMCFFHLKIKLGEIWLILLPGFKKCKGKKHLLCICCYYHYDYRAKNLRFAAFDVWMETFCEYLYIFAATVGSRENAENFCASEVFCPWPFCYFLSNVFAELLAG